MANWQTGWNRDALTVKAAHDAKSSQRAGLQAYLTNKYYANTSETDNAWLPVGFGDQLGDPTVDVMARIRGQEIKLQEMEEKQGYWSIQQMTQYAPQSKRNRPVANALTAELRHPSGEGTTQFVAYSFMPADPTVFQAERARQLAATFGSDPLMHRTEQAYLQAAPNVAFRYQTTGG